jgi:hypothetical protein
MKRKVCRAVAAATLLVFMSPYSLATGAELTCFRSAGEATGYYFVAFGVSQGHLARLCDASYAKWRPGLSDVVSHVMASNAQMAGDFPKAAEQLANRLAISREDLFAIVSSNTVPLLPKTTTFGECQQFAKRLEIRLKSADDMINYAIAAAGREKQAGHICK